jgi:hypothetical protein
VTPSPSRHPATASSRLTCPTLTSCGSAATSAGVQHSARHLHSWPARPSPATPSDVSARTGGGKDLSPSYQERSEPTQIHANGGASLQGRTPPPTATRTYEIRSRSVSGLVSPSAQVGRRDRIGREDSRARGHRPAVAFCNWRCSRLDVRDPICSATWSPRRSGRACRNGCSASGHRRSLTARRREGTCQGLRGRSSRQLVPFHASAKLGKALSPWS